MVGNIAEIEVRYSTSIMSQDLWHNRRKPVWLDLEAHFTIDSRYCIKREHHRHIGSP